MIGKAISTARWLPYYYGRELRRLWSGERKIAPKHIYFCICDHYEPYWNGAGQKQARQRIQRWLDEYPKVADRYRDSEGNRLKYSFFYPEEEYRAEDLDALAALCHEGYGEVEIHLHHDNDTADNLRSTLIDYKQRLHERHGLLSRNRSGEIVYGFIHGNWALCNSRPDGRWCGVNDELSILQQTGCYADFTMPSAPSDTQTRKVNSIYYATSNSRRAKCHDWGEDVEVGRQGDGLVVVQGPLALDWSRRKYAVVPKLENGGLLANFPPSFQRVRLWVDAGVSIAGAPEHIFVKVHTHGAQEDIMSMFFDRGGLAQAAENLIGYGQELGASVHWVSAREMFQKICTISSAGQSDV